MSALAMMLSGGATPPPPPSDFLIDALVGTPGNDLQGSVAPTGGTWVRTTTEELFSNPTGVSPSVPGHTGQYYNNVAPPSANYNATITFKAGTSPGDYQELRVHVDDTGHNWYGVRYDPTVPQFQLVRVDNNVYTVLQSTSWNLDSGGNGQGIINLKWDAGTLSWSINASAQTGASDNTYPSAGFAGIAGTHVAFANSTTIQDISAVVN